MNDQYDDVKQFDLIVSLIKQTKNDKLLLEFYRYFDMTIKDLRKRVNEADKFAKVSNSKFDKNFLHHL